MGAVTASTTRNAAAGTNAQTDNGAIIIRVQHPCSGSGSSGVLINFGSNDIYLGE
jgi:hypothetical protein